VFEFNRALRPIDLTLKQAIVLSLTEELAGRFIVEHREIVSDDEIEFVIGPIVALNRLTGHGDKNRLLGHVEQSGRDGLFRF
jgi:hypothetical protein